MSFAGGWSRRPLALAAAAAIAACSSGSGHHPDVCAPSLATPAGQPFTPSASDCQLAPALPAGQLATLSGTVTYDLVPATYDASTRTGGLDFAHAQPRPVREGDVEVRQCDQVLARTTTDAAGRYTATFTPGAVGRLYVAAIARTADPPIQVVDNANQGAPWAVASPLDSASATLDLHALHGWTGCGYGAWRAAGPFAILDSMYTAAHRLLDVRAVPFGAAPLTVNWSPENSPSLIGTSAYDPNDGQIWILGAAGIDTDEFDRVVIVHEWTHYLEDHFSRDDTPGGIHYYAAGDVLDPALSFSEGFATAFAGMIFEERTFAETYWGRSGLTAWGFDLEVGPTAYDDPAPSAFSELSVVRAMWDLHDAVPPGDSEPWDAATIDLGSIYDTLAGPQRTTPAVTTLASFVAGLKAQPGVDGTIVDAVLAHYAIGPISSAFGDGDPALRTMFTDVPPPSATPASFDVTLDGRYRCNERPQNQFFVFTAAGQSAAVTASASYDVDLYAYASGSLLAADTRSYAESHTANVSFTTTPGTVYVVVLNGWGGLAPDCQPTGLLGPYGATVTFSN